MATGYFVYVFLGRTLREYHDHICLYIVVNKMVGPNVTSSATWVSEDLSTLGVKVPETL